MSNADKLKALQLTLDKLEKSYGKGTIMKLGDTVIEPTEVISTGSIGLDIALGVGGLPKGRVIEIYGPESSGKTTLAIHAIAEAQKKGGIAAFIDAEHAFDRFRQPVRMRIRPDEDEQARSVARRCFVGYDVLRLDRVEMPRAVDRDDDRARFDCDVVLGRDLRN